MSTTKHAFRFRRLRFETLEVVVESPPELFPLLEAYKIARRKTSVWKPDEKAIGFFLQTKVDETTKDGVQVPSKLQEELDRSADGKTYILAEYDRTAIMGKVFNFGNRLRKSKQIDVSIALDIIISLMQEIDIPEVLMLTGEDGSLPPLKAYRKPKKTPPKKPDQAAH